MHLIHLLVKNVPYTVYTVLILFLITERCKALISHISYYLLRHNDWPPDVAAHLANQKPDMIVERWLTPSQRLNRVAIEHDSR